jgi:PhzF family phenazine biosynthesis protein
LQTYVVDAFTKDGIGGNPAGVIVDSEALTPEQMQQIAKTLGFSETAFVSRKSKDRHQIRFFTPNAEVPLCGHATIASYALLGSLERITAGTFEMETLAGPQRITYSKDGLVSMTQNLPQFGDRLSPEVVAPCLGLNRSDIENNNGLPIQIASTGLQKIFVPVKSLERLRAINPDFTAIEKVSRSVGTIGMYCYSLESLHGSTAHCRNFAPVVGIMEDSATGTSAAALSCVLHHFDVLPNKERLELCFEQGYCIEQPAELIVFLEASQGKVTSIQVAGRAALRESSQLKI